MTLILIQVAIVVAVALVVSGVLRHAFAPGAVPHAFEASVYSGRHRPGRHTLAGAR